MTTTEAYDNLNRLTGISSAPTADATLSFNYAYNSANQRTAMTNADNSRWAYGYDSLGQVASGKGSWSDGTLVAGQQFEYGFDDIGNRRFAASGGDPLGANVSADFPKGAYFRGELSVDNSAASVWFGATNVAVLNNGTNADIVTTNIGNLFLPKTPEAFSYDADGNLTNDGRWAYTWDAENRLLNLTANSSVPSAAKLKLDFAYDHRSRRTSKAVWAWNGSAYVGQSTNKFVYDDWNLTAELDHTNRIARSYLWGLDLSGSLQGAGGVGGLLAIKVTTNGAHFAALDGNGNVAALINATNATLSAQYDYSPFGELIRRTGSAAKTNPLRFSTKYQDDETDFLYYGFRYYTPSTGRWLSRDPIGQIGSLNLDAYVGNAPVDSFDPFGLCQGNGCVAMSAAAIPGFGFKNPLTGAHKSSCTWLEGKIRGYLSSKEDIRAWDRFVGGTGNDIELTDSEMASAVRAAADFQAGIKKLSEDCKVNPFGWNNRTAQVGASVGAPWSLSLGRVSIKLTTSCACRTLTWEACIFDKYDFDPTWFLGGRQPTAEMQTILVWAAQHVGQCGWKEFHHKGCKDGFIAN